MEIKVGEYIRTIDGYIRKVTEVEAEDTIPIVVDEPILDDDTKWRNCYQVMECIDKERITKHSPNIIDLIEVGDYVNGYKVIDIVKGFKVIIDKLELDTTTGTYKNIGIKDIKSILAHEQMEEMEYRV